MKNYKMLEEKIHMSGIKSLGIEDVVSLRDYYVTKLDSKQPNKNQDIFSKFLSLEKYILCEYTNIKNKLDDTCEVKNITRENLCNIINENQLNLSLFFENDILSLIKLVEVIENV